MLGNILCRSYGCPSIAVIVKPMGISGVVRWLRWTFANPGPTARSGGRHSEAGKKMDLWFSGAEGSHRFGMVLGVAFLVFSVWNKVPQTITNHMINYEKWEWKLSRKRPSSIDAGPSGVRKVSGEDCVVSIAPLLSLNAVPVVAVGQDLGSINPIPSAVASPLQNGLRVGGYPLLA